MTTNLQVFIPTNVKNTYVYLFDTIDDVNMWVDTGCSPLTPLYRFLAKSGMYSITECRTIPLGVSNLPPLPKISDALPTFAFIYQSPNKYMRYDGLNFGVWAVTSVDIFGEYNHIFAMQTQTHRV